MSDRRDVRILPRGRVAKWSKEQMDTLSTPELRALRAGSRGGIRSDGAVVLTAVADEVQKREDDSRPWSDTPGGKERLEHCRIALERGAAEGLLSYGKRVAGAPPKAPPRRVVSTVE